MQTHTSAQKRGFLSLFSFSSLMAIDLFHFIIAQCSLIDLLHHDVKKRYVSAVFPLSLSLFFLLPHGY
jgi:hypothetical protein